MRNESIDCLNEILNSAEWQTGAPGMVPSDCTVDAWDEPTRVDWACALTCTQLMAMGADDAEVIANG